MLIHVSAEISLKSESLDDALREFSAFLERHLIASEGSEVAIALSESGARGNSALAERVPDDTKEFGLDLIPRGTPLTAAQFRNEVLKKKPKRSRSQLRLPTASIEDTSRVLQRLAERLPSSGRGIILVIYLTNFRFPSDAKGPAVDASFSRFRRGAEMMSASLSLRFQALSLKDPVVAATTAAATQHVGLRFDKPLAAFTEFNTVVPSGTAPVLVPDKRLQPPSPEAQLIVLQSFWEALARAADQVGARTADLDSVPLLFSRSGSHEKRMRDVMAGKKEKIDLPSRLRRFIKERFPEYAVDAADAEQLWFRKSVAPTLDLLLMFDKIHQWGLGKSFSIDFAVDFPNTAFGGLHTGGSGTRASLFRLFHQDWDKQVWAYSTSEELTTVLGGCGSLLGRVLPALGEQCKQLLLPLPGKLPEGIEQRGALSAREAFELILPMAREWARDSRLENLGPMNMLPYRADVISAITREGRLQSHGAWSFKFLSKRRDFYCMYTVPHTGRIYWNYYHVPEVGIPKYSAVLENDNWIDSTDIAQRAFAAVEQQAAGLRISQIWLSLGDPERYRGKFVWQAQCMAFGKSLSERRDISVKLDPVTGEFL